MDLWHEHNRNLILLAALTFMLALPFPSYAAKSIEEEHTAQYYASRALEFENNNQWESAKREIDEGLSQYPYDPDLLYLNGRYYYQAQEDIKTARYNLIKALQQNDEHFLARRLLVDVEDDAGNYSSAICYINELLEFEPYDRDLWRRKIALYEMLGNGTEASRALERLARIYPTDSIVQHARAMRNRETWNQMVRSNTISEAAANLERYIELDPKNLDYYYQLISLYRQLGENERALGTVNMGLYNFPYNPELVRLGANILSGMGEYTRALNFLRENRVQGPLYNSVLAELAADDRLRDPYEANGRLFARTGNRVALNYLLNTALTRGYYEDAKYYINEAIKLDGLSTELLMKEYALEKRFGNERTQMRILQELYAMNPTDPEIVGDYAELMLSLASRDMEARQWADAEAHLQRALDVMSPSSPQWAAAVSRQISLLGTMGRLRDARNVYEYNSRLAPSERRRFASAYEEIASKRIHDLIEENEPEKAYEEAKALLSVMPDSESALRACINLSQTLGQDKEFRRYAERGYKAFPDNPYFVTKWAVALQEEGRLADALAILGQRSDGDHYLNSQLSAAYQGVSFDWAMELLKRRMPEVVIEKIDNALKLNPDNKELLYAKGLAYEQMRQYDKAYEFQNGNYNPSNAEQADWYQHMRFLRYRSFRNRLTASYQYASYDTRSEALGSVAHMYSIANLTYDRINSRNVYTLSVNYKGLDGYIQDRYWNSGGMGFEVQGLWEHSFNSHWSMSIGGAWSNQYFNKYSGRLGFNWYIKRGWELGLKGEYRRTPPSMFFFAGDQTIVTENREYNMYMASPSVQKSWDRIATSLTGDLIYMRHNLFYNVTWRGTIYINEDRTSQVGLFGSYGTFPQLEFYDLSMLSSSARSNISVGFVMNFLVTKNWILGINGSWNTFYNPQIAQNGQVISMYRNIYILGAHIQVAF